MLGYNGNDASRALIETESAFHANPDLRTVKPPQEQPQQPAVDGKGARGAAFQIAGIAPDAVPAAHRAEPFKTGLRTRS